ncbi:hypothetical protein [Arthrobacter oryzae]|uniref:hypothetical protein n=1 Tax=Arthrobacter oryzae TaxID=409290 RepID=UPI0028552475|nr:hypothetical protein [Arthrobacter oryzae]MDR6508089.1 hypothetical protein [Arthrobacter oryzae]
MKARLNLITAGTTSFRYLAYAGAAGGILGIITDPAESVALFALVLSGWGLIAVLALIILAVTRLYLTGPLPKLGRPTGTHAKILLLAMLLPLSGGWSVDFFFVSIGLILCGLTVRIGLALRPVNEEDEAPNRGNDHPDQTPAGRFTRALARVLDDSRPPLPNLTPGEVAGGPLRPERRNTNRPQIPNGNRGQGRLPCDVSAQ